MGKKTIQLYHRQKKGLDKIGICDGKPFFTWFEELYDYSKLSRNMKFHRFYFFLQNQEHSISIPGLWISKRKSIQDYLSY